MTKWKIFVLSSLLCLWACKFEFVSPTEEHVQPTGESTVVVLQLPEPVVMERDQETDTKTTQEASDASQREMQDAGPEETDEVTIAFGTGGDGLNFKVPVPVGYQWEVTQSWADHCGECSRRYRDWGYCSLSHMGNCCKYGIDFNLPGYSDNGKAVLASGDGVVKELGSNRGWGNFVLLDHGENVCSRYAHLLSNSSNHLSENDDVCQGLKIGEIGNSGASEGPHLHFQFENCETGEGIARAFDDGNAVPICTRGADRFDDDGNYNFLELNNMMRLQCGASEPQFSGAQLPIGGWYQAACGHLPECPLVLGCERNFDHEFIDAQVMPDKTLKAAMYLWRECAINGMENGTFAPFQWLTRAEALKVGLFLFGLMEECGVGVHFEDVAGDSWYYPVIACGLRQGIVDNSYDLFYPNREVTLAEAAKFVVESAVRAELIRLQRPRRGHFPNFGLNHWAFAYIETLYAYGGIQGNRNSMAPDDLIQRGDFAVMLAALSPCYCENVGCEEGCTCDQESLSCNGGEELRESGGGPEEEEEIEDPPLEEYDEPEAHEDEAEDQEEPEREVVEEAEELPYYVMEILGPGGWVEVLTSSGERLHFELLEEALVLSGPREDLPLAAVIQGGPGNLYIDEFEPGRDPFALWHSYEGGLTLNPEGTPDTETFSFESHIDNLRVLMLAPWR